MMSVGRRLACLAVCLAAQPSASAKTCSAKWAQYIDGTVVAAISLKRAGGLCQGETATVEEQVLTFRMQNHEPFVITLEWPAARSQHNASDRECQQATANGRLAPPPPPRQKTLEKILC